MSHHDFLMPLEPVDAIKREAARLRRLAEQLEEVQPEDAAACTFAAALMESLSIARGI